MSWANRARDLLAQNRLDEAIQVLAEEADRSDEPGLLMTLLQCYLNANRNTEALAVGQRLMPAFDRDQGVLLNLGLANMRVNRYEDALAAFRRVLDLNPSSIEALVNLGAVYFGLGMVSEALDVNKRATAARPDLVAVWQNYLAILNYDDSIDVDTLLSEHRRGGAHIARHVGPRPERYANAPDPERRLRIGYLSGDMFNHPASHYVEPVLRCHDRGRFDVHVYSLITWRDVVTDALRGYVGPNWHDVGTLDDAQLFDRIQADGIDILVDLSGHTSRNRVLVCARRPAPLVANWVGYLNTMGMEGYSYALLDQQLITQRAAQGFAERVVALPTTAFAYNPLASPRVPAPFPHLKNGHIVFGCFNNPAKLSNRCIATWARILREVQDSRILFKYKTFDAGIVKERVTTAFAAHGVSADRLVFTGFVPLGAYLDTFAEIDIALDTFPYTGVTTTMHTLYMGVPLISLDGQTPMQRFGNAALRQIGRPDWIASTVDDYVAAALRLVGEAKANPGLRAEVHRRMLAAPMMRHEAMVRDLELGYRHIWRNWCAQAQT